MDTKKIYHEPTLTDLGDVVEQTLGVEEFDPSELNMKRITADI
jgi:hypothetical protein